MIEKIDKIRDLLIVPNVDEQPKLAINQMKILNLLVELRAEAEQLTIPVVCSLPTGDKLHKTIDGRFVLKSISFPIANKFNTHPEKVGDVVEQIIENLNGIR